MGRRGDEVRIVDIHNSEILLMAGNSATRSSKCNAQSLCHDLNPSAQATELALEDKITERLKAYQRRLAQVHEHSEL
jgi:hypothetical protein